MKVSIAQYGARMHYGVGRALNRHSALERVYTDFYLYQREAAVLSMIGRVLGNHAVRRAAGRTSHDLPSSQIVRNIQLGLQSSLRLLRCGRPDEILDAHCELGRIFATWVQRADALRSEIMYGYASSSLEIFRPRNRAALRSVVEAPIPPRRFVCDVLSRESDRWADWSERDASDDAVGRFSEREMEEYELADMIVCPSEFVVRHFSKLGAAIASKCVLVPYGVDVPVGEMSVGTKRDSGRRINVLFPGTVGLRKGIQYLYLAAKLVDRSEFCFRAVGPIELTATAQDEVSRFVDLIGPVPRSQMLEQWRWADLVVLPSLCEGSATVLYEAAAHGLPIVTTFESGTVLEAGESCIMIPSRDAEAIARVLEEASMNPETLYALGEKAKVRSKMFGVKEYGERLYRAVAGLV